MSGRLLRVSSFLTSVRETVTRRRISPEEAWNIRAQEAPDWYVSYSRSQEESETKATTDLLEVLDGVDPAQLKEWKVLDVGCGTGRILKVLAAKVREAYGVDFSAEMIRLARSRLEGVPNVTTLKNDGATLSMFDDETFDFVFSFAVFQHIPSRSQIDSYLKEFYRILKSGGEVKLPVDGRGDSLLWRLLKKAIGNDSWSGVFFSRIELLTLVRAHGFEVIHCDHAPRQTGQSGLQGLRVHARKPASVAHPQTTPPSRRS